MREQSVAEVRSQFEDLARLARHFGGESADQVVGAAELVFRALDAGHKLFFCGNGGSAADAQHLATEYVVRLRRERRPLPAIALTTDTSLLTAASNDLGFDQIFARQLLALASAGDVLFLHSTTGDSPNLIEAARVARATHVTTVALLARGGGRLKSEVDMAVVVPTDNAARAQEMHLAIGHVICDMVEARLVNTGTDSEG